MSDKKIKAMIANTFLEVADALETFKYVLSQLKAILDK